MPRNREAGYNFVILVVALSVLTILLGLALPLWSRQIQREKEEELITRGLQYAEAIRVFRSRFGRLPVRLEELVEVKPRSIRRLWKDPMTEDGNWGLIFEGAGSPIDPNNPNPQIPGQPGRPGQANGPNGKPLGQGSFNPGSSEDAEAPVPSSDFGDEDGRVTLGPIRGVHSLSKETSIKTFLGRKRHDQWEFTAELLTAQGGGFQATQPGQEGGSLSSLVAKTQWIGRPWREDVLPPGAVAGGQGPNGLPPGTVAPGDFGTPLTPDIPLPPGGRPGLPPSDEKPPSGAEDQ